MQQFSDVQITQVCRENESVASIFMEPVPDSFKQAKPGQYMLIRLPFESGWTETHPFTITSAPEDDAVRITVKKVGKFTTALHTAAVPCSAQVSGPVGSFGDQVPSMKSGVFIAGGIGITPFVSILEKMYAQKSKIPVVLFWANMTAEDFFFHDLFRKYARTLDIRIIMIASQPPAVTESASDRITGITGLLTGEVIQKYVSAQLRSEASWFLCGSPGMQQYVFSQLAPLAVLPESVTVERVGQFMAAPK
jgi:ferredoxin-NADP reductase